MKTISKTLALDKVNYYETHLSIVNCLLPVKMTPTEIKILARFMSFKGELAKERFGATGKKLIRESMKLTHQGLSNYMNSLIKKRFIIELQGKLTIWPILHPEDTEQEYMIKLKNLE